MNEGNQDLSIDQFNRIIEMLDPCMDDYLYIYDLKEDLYSISVNANERFAMPSNRFHNVTETLKTFVYPDDFEFLQDDLNQVLSGEKYFHNLQYRWLDRNGRAVWINCRGRVVSGEDGAPRFLVGCINEIGIKPKADNISGLLGESSLQQEMKQHIDDCTRGFLLRLGIDNFKDINENKGMDYGNMILRETAECIEAVISPGQKLYRIVADEFIVLDYSGADVEEAKKLYFRIVQSINSFIEEKCYEVFFTISAGILDFSDAGTRSYFHIMKLSEFSLNEAKNGGKNKYYLYEKKDYLKFLHQKRLIHAMRQSVYHGFCGFEVHYQPIIDIGENRMSSAEALLRFRTEEGEAVSPAEFIPLLEESGLIIPVGKWVLNEAMRACGIIQKTLPDFRISINLSYIQVLKSNVLEEILSAFRENGLKPGSVMVELTESGFLESNDNFLNFCDGLKKNGILLAIDDFGTGYSNFHYLYNLSPNTIKIDRSFTLKALNNDYEYNLLQHMVDMTHSIQLKLCIEGIETQQELAHISEIKPDYIQGYYFGRPCPLDCFLEDYTKNRQDSKN